MSDSHKTIVTIKNRLGLHARPAMALVDLANQFEAEVTLQREDNPEVIDGKSIMQVMLLAATPGTKIVITANGGDAETCVAAIVDLVNRGFDED